MAIAGNISKNKILLQRNMLGFCLLLCMLVGGGTARYLSVDLTLQLLTVTITAYVLFSRENWNNAARLGLVMMLCVLALFILQVVPLPIGFLEWARPFDLLPLGISVESPIYVASLSVGSTRTVQALLFALTPLMFFTALVSLPQGKVFSVVPFFMIGLWANLIAAGLQYSFSGNNNLGDFLGYEVMVGMFANRNHFATLIFSSIPLIIFFGFMNNRVLAPSFSIVFILLILLAAGSRAGILIGLTVVIVSVISLLWSGRLGVVSSLVLLATIAIVSYGAYEQISSRALDPNLGRLEFAVTTWHAIIQNWILGTGFGTFDMVYPLYEDPLMVFSHYVNHAHNDYLEILLEGGIPAFTLFIIYIYLLIKKFIDVRKQPLARLVLLSIFVIFIHSTVDYPLRTMGVVMIFAFLNALFFSYGNRREAEVPSGIEQYSRN
ncbi:O-antigen ligase family protein [Ochrobactrum chromiisoli]|uniref:O-antigen ligase family protein n=1 Tax=Ochrobactrum chromiisoli TaxID=2993941 RepID=A0ABT3QP49_9HYPH|nr:O-antigen ligase family protein [Ochrobactrum chromiisoli]MCX2697379.1 O-antigen ligase family protein [Ochrobactrum chromiisoli]